MKNLIKILLMILIAGTVTADNNLINNCTFQNNTYAGITLTDKDNITVNNSVIQNNSVYGIYSENSNFTVNNSDVCLNNGWDVWSDRNNFGRNNTLGLVERFRDVNYYLGTYMCRHDNYPNHWWYGYRSLSSYWRDFYRMHQN